MARSKNALCILVALFQAVHHLKSSIVVDEWVNDGWVTSFPSDYPEVITDTYDPLKTLRRLGEQKPSSLYVFLLQAAVNISSIAFSNEKVMSYYNIHGQGNYTLAKRASITRSVSNQLNSSYFPTMSRYCSEYPDACGYLTPPLFYHHMKGLHAFMDKFYAALIDAFGTSATKLDSNQTPGGEPEICKTSTERLWCEVQILQSMMGKRCWRVTDGKCANNASICPLSETAYPYKLIDIVRVRHVYLALGIAFCGGLRGREMEMVSVMTDFSAAADSWDANQPSPTVWTYPSVTIANEEADRLKLPKGWPSSGAAVSNYSKLASNIDSRMENEWKEKDLFNCIVFHPCTEPQYAIIGDIGKPQQEVETKEQFSKNAANFESSSVPMFFIQREDANILVSKRRDRCSKAQKDGWFKKHKKEIIEKFSPRLTDSLAEIKDGFKEFAGWNNCFQGAAIISCAYRFVWYELAWTYYKSFSPCKFCVDIGEESFDPCLRIALVP